MILHNEYCLTILHTIWILFLPDIFMLEQQFIVVPVERLTQLYSVGWLSLSQCVIFYKPSSCCVKS